MLRMILRCAWVGLPALLWWMSPTAAEAWERPPLKINTKWEFQVEVKVGPDFRRPTAPWYAYFPADPRMLPSPQASPYPSWPMQFPPRGVPAAPSQAQSPALPRDTQTAQVGSNQNANGMNVQPVGFVPARAPSYWYRNP